MTTVADHGAAAQAAAAGRDPALSASQNTVVRAVVADPGIIAKVQSLAAAYRSQLVTAAKVDPTTLAALNADPNDQSAELKALAEISGAGQATLMRGVGIYLQYPGPVATVGALDPATRQALLSGAAGTAAVAQAAGEVATASHVATSAAAAQVQALLAVPPADRSFMAGAGAAVVNAVDRLQALAAMPSSATAYLSKYGTALQAPKVQQTLRMLQQVQTAQQRSRAQWQHYFWIAVGGEVVFIPLMFLMAGYWDPRKARRQEREHEAMVAAELARLR